MADISSMSSASFGLAQQRNTMQSGAAGTRTNIDTTKSEKEQLYDVAKEYEAIFLAEFLKQARAGELSEGLFTSEAGKTFQGMLDVEVARSSSSGVNLGIAEALVAQLGSGLSGRIK